MTRMRRQLSFLMILALLFSMIGLESYAEYRSFPNQKVASDKVFVIRFNDIVDRSNLNPGSIRVQGEEGDIVVTIENGSDGHSLIVQPPVEGYIAGKTYTLIIQDVTNNNGRVLKQSVQMQFDIEEKEEKKEEQQQEMPALPPSAPSSPGSGGGSGFGSVAPLPPAVSNPDPVLPLQPPASSDPEVSVPESVPLPSPAPVPIDPPQSSPGLSPAQPSTDQPNPPLTDSQSSDAGSKEPQQETPKESTETDLSKEGKAEEITPEVKQPVPPISVPEPPVKNPPNVSTVSPETVLASLTRGINKNAVQYKIHEGSEKEEVRTVLWVKGITAPELSEFREVIDGSYVVRQVDYQAGQGWYDVNKSKDGKHKVNDDYLCFAAVASNMLHWWMDQNDAYIQEYIEQQEKLVNDPPSNDHLSAEKIALLKSLRHSFNDQQDSVIFKKFTAEFGHLTNGFQADLLIDMVLNGYRPKENSVGGVPINDDKYEVALEALAKDIDSRGGLLYPAFGGEKFTYRTYGVGSYEQFGNYVKMRMSGGDMMGLVYPVLGKAAHIVTVWGAEFDMKERLVAVYISDSDDQNEGTNVGMKRLEIRNVDNVAKIGSDQSNLRSGAPIDHVHVMLSGEARWQSYLAKP